MSKKVEKMTAEKMNKEKPKNLHAGHRERMKERLFANGIEGFSDHEMLEFFLFFALPYVNTNNIAHELLYKFGSLTDVINADYDRLTEVKGLGKNAATMFCFFRSFAKIYLQRQYLKTLDVRSKESLAAYCKTLFMNSDTEEIRMIYLRDDLTVLKDVLVCSGTPGKVDMSIRAMAESILNAKVNRVVMTHNHPKGSSIPSRADVDETGRISEILRQIDVELVDHIIIGMDGEWSMRFDHTLTEIWKDF